MNEQPPHRRDCQPWERPWRTFCVDEKLKDNWLERLNDLENFHLISICQGHPEGSLEIPHRPMHFNLRLKDEFVNDMITGWDEVKDGVRDALDRTFNADHTAAHLELRCGYIKDKKGIAAQDIILLKVSRQIDLLTTQTSDPLREWFDENVTAAESFDEFMTSLLSR